MGSQVTTKRGDDGESRAMSGDRYSKAHPIFEACGNVDTARARTASLRLHLLDANRDDADPIADFLFWLLHTYFLIGSHCNDPLNKHPEYRNRDLSKESLDRLETFQADLEKEVALPKFFIVAASTNLAAECDILCTDVRHLERSIVALKESIPEFDGTVLLPFVNRLSDTLFMLARKFEDGNHQAVDYGVLD